MHHLIGGRSRFLLPDGYMMETSMKISKLEDEKASGRMEEDEINMRYPDQHTKQLPDPIFKILPGSQIKR